MPVVIAIEVSTEQSVLGSIDDARSPGRRTNREGVKHRLAVCRGRELVRDRFR